MLSVNRNYSKKVSFLFLALLFISNLSLAENYTVENGNGSIAELTYQLALQGGAQERIFEHLEGATTITYIVIHDNGSSLCICKKTISDNLKKPKYSCEVSHSW